jgi:hypothetical protein
MKYNENKYYHFIIINSTYPTEGSHYKILLKDLMIGFNMHDVSMDLVFLEYALFL